VADVCHSGTATCHWCATLPLEGRFCHGGRTIIQHISLNNSVNDTNDCNNSYVDLMSNVQYLFIVILALKVEIHKPLNYDVAFVVDVVLGSRRHRSRSHIYRV